MKAGGLTCAAPAPSPSDLSKEAPAASVGRAFYQIALTVTGNDNGHHRNPFYRVRLLAAYGRRSAPPLHARGGAWAALKELVAEGLSDAFHMAM